MESTAGYAEGAEVLARQYESVTFEEVHAGTLAFLPVASCRVADIGAGTGRDAAALARRGHRVTAVEPVRELRIIGERLHGDTGITWVDDSLPELEKVGGPFGLVLCTAVWMHLDAGERDRALRRVAGLLEDGGRLVLTIRHGPVPPGRRMFEVAPEEVVSAGAELGLGLLHRGHHGDVMGRADVTWSNLVLERSERLIR